MPVLEFSSLIKISFLHLNLFLFGIIFIFFHFLHFSLIVVILFDFSIFTIFLNLDIWFLLFILKQFQSL